MVSILETLLVVQEGSTGKVTNHEVSTITQKRDDDVSLHHGCSTVYGKRVSVELT